MILKKLTSIMLASGVILALPITSFAEPQNKNTNADSTVICATDTIIGYALQFNMDPNIPYVLGGSRWSGDGTPNPSDSENYNPSGNRWIFNEMTLEKLSADKTTGTDCTGFVSQAYSHFGCSVLAGSSIINQSAVSYIYDESDALPGDVVWWKDAHAGLYLGKGYVLHTNGAPDNMYIHISKLYTQTATPTCFLRMTDNLSLLNLNAYCNGKKVDAEYIYRHQNDLIFDTGKKSFTVQTRSSGQPARKTKARNRKKQTSEFKKYNYRHPMYLLRPDLTCTIEKFVNNQITHYKKLSLIQKQKYKIQSAGLSVLHPTNLPGIHIQ